MKQLKILRGSLNTKENTLELENRFNKWMSEISSTTRIIKVEYHTVKYNKESGQELGSAIYIEYDAGEIVKEKVPADTYNSEA